MIVAAVAFAPLRALAGVHAPLWAVWVAPRVLALVFALATDVAVWAIARGLWPHSPGAARVAAFASAANALALVGGSRASANALMSTLVTVALACAAHAHVSVWVAGSAGGAAALACAVHATAAPPLLAGALCTAVALPRGTRLRTLFAVFVGAAAVTVAERYLDRWAAGADAVAPLPALNFFRVNIVDGLNALSGSHSAAWYILVGVPAAASIWTVSAVRGVGAALCEEDARVLAPAAAAVALVSSLSFVAHKELRYVLALPPIIAVYAGIGAQKNVSRLFRAFAALIAVTVAAYVGTVHQRGAVAAVEHVAFIADAWLTLSRSAASAASQNFTAGWSAASATLSPLAVHFLTPCHATPLYATLHWPVEARILECAPGGAAGNRARAASAAVRACDTLPKNITETGLWIADKRALLGALYGAAPSPPRVCAARNGRRNGRGEGGSHWAWAASESRSAADAAASLDELFAVSAAPFAAATGDAECQAALHSHAHKYSVLPSHAVLFDTDAASPDVGAWLRENDFSLGAAFSMGHVSGDAHARSEGRGEPAAIQVWEHACFTGLLDGGDTGGT